MTEVVICRLIRMHSPFLKNAVVVARVERKPNCGPAAPNKNPLDGKVLDLLAAQSAPNERRPQSIASIYTFVMLTSAPAVGMLSIAHSCSSNASMRLAARCLRASDRNFSSISASVIGFFGWPR
jgi:hypothetical protein